MPRRLEKVKCSYKGCKEMGFNKWCEEHRAKVRKAQLKKNNAAWKERAKKGVVLRVKLVHNGKPTRRAMMDPKLLEIAKKRLEELAKEELKKGKSKKTGRVSAATRSRGDGTSARKTSKPAAGKGRARPTSRTASARKGTTSTSGGRSARAPSTRKSKGSAPSSTRTQPSDAATRSRAKSTSSRPKPSAPHVSAEKSMRASAPISSHAGDTSSRPPRSASSTTSRAGSASTSGLAPHTASKPSKAANGMLVPQGPLQMPANPVIPT